MQHKAVFLLLSAISTSFPVLGQDVTDVIQPTAITLAPHQKQQFTATGYGQNLIWWIKPLDMGTITQTGLYTAPGGCGIVYIHAMPNIGGPYYIDTVYLPGGPNPVGPCPIAPPPATKGISVKPGFVYLQVGQSATFQALIGGVASNQQVGWSVSPNLGSIVNGSYTAPASLGDFGHEVEVTISATSLTDASAIGTATVLIGQPISAVSVSIAPGPTTLTTGQSTQYTATVVGAANPGINWSLTPNLGTLSSNGFYTAPANIPSQEMVTLTAISQQDPTKTASVSLMLKPPNVAVSLSPGSAVLTGGQSAIFQPLVSGTPNTGLTWSLSPQVGTIAGGVYQAPSIVGAQQTVTVTATSMADPTKSASVTVWLQPVAVSVGPASVSVGDGGSATFAASVTGTNNTGITWSLNPPIGTVVNGLYTAPAVITTPQMVMLTAASVVDSTKTATASIMLTSASLSVSPGSASLTGGQTATFTPWVSGTSNTAVTWSLSPQVGTIMNGVYQAPPTIASQQAVMVTATSVADSTKSASAMVSLQPVGVTVGPASVSLGDGGSANFAATVTGTSNTAVTWSLNPAVGTILNGVYTAPSSINNSQTVTLTAASVVDSTKTATASITLTAVSVGLSPGSASLTTGQSATFTPAVSGTPNTAVTWSLSPQVGTISNGVYQAPAIVASQQTVMVTATSVVDSTKTATASITLTAVSVGLSPGSASLTGGQSATFTPAVSGTPNTAVTWSLSPQVGTISNGVYQAPAIVVASQQTVMVTATSVADSTKSASATVSLQPVGVTVGPGSASVSAGQSAAFSASVTGASNTAVVWSLNPAVGIILNGIYTAPAVINSAQTVTVTAASVADSSKTATATVSLTPSSNSFVTVTLPLEVSGPGGTTVSASVMIPSGANLSGQLQLWLQIHGLEYQTQASVQVNSGAWTPINDTTATYLGHGKTFGGIGGGFTTLQITMNLPAGSIQTGQNTLTFQFNGTDGTSSGFRVLAFNILAADGSQLIPQTTFTQDDPSSWTPPLNSSADIQAGLTLWKTANLTAPGSGAIQAKCGSCHTQDGRDLKYFNYSNQSIEARAMFHGLTAQQGAQIASYIRTLNVPTSTYARPWNPPYQPGPGMDNRPVSDWAAGAGLDAVLDNDADTLSYIMPGGSTANLAANAYLNQREIPIMLQLPDWNHWLPTVHPIDAFGAQFSNSGLFTGYSLIRSELIPNDPTTYKNYYQDASLQWLTNQNSFFAAVRQPQSSSAWSNPVYDREIYSVGQWAMVKSWEINQEYGLEGMSQVVFGPQAADRAWYSNQAFFTSPFMLMIPRPAPGIGNGSIVAHIYLSFVWYQLQLILNDGNGQAQGTWPIDRGYALSYLHNDLTWDSTFSQARVGTAGLMMEWLAKILQSGIDPGDANPYFMIVFPGQVSTWSEVPSSQRVQLMNTWTSTWNNFVQSLSAQQLFTGQSGVAPPVPQTFSLVQPGSFTGDLSWALPRLLYEGVDPSLLNQIAGWASGFWPTYNWLTAVNQPCSTGNLGEIMCP